MTRGAPREVRRDRTVPAEMLVPKGELARARKRATQTRGMTQPTILDLRRGDDALVACLDMPNTCGKTFSLLDGDTPLEQALRGL